MATLLTILEKAAENPALQQFILAILDKMLANPQATATFIAELWKLFGGTVPPPPQA